MAVAKLARLNYAVRTGAFAWCFMTIGLHMWERGYGVPAWALLALQFLLYPHLMYLRAILSPKPSRGQSSPALRKPTHRKRWWAAKS